MIIEASKILLDKPRRILMNHQALFKAEGQINAIRGSSTFARVSIDYLIVNAFNALTILKAPFPLDLLASLLWASIVREGKEEIAFEQVFELLDNSETSTNDIAVALFEAYCKTAGKNLKRDDDATPDADQEKKTENLETGSGVSAPPSSTLN